MATVVVAGEVVLDRFTGPAGSRDIAGGSAANTAIALQQAGHRVSLRARYSQDADGRFLRQAATAWGLDLRDSVLATEPATVVAIRLSPDGVPVYEFAMAGTADWQWSRQELDRPLPPDCDAIIVGSLAAVLSPGCAALQAWAVAASGAGITLCYDPNARPSAIADREAPHIRATIAEWVAISEVVKVSDEDLSWIEPAAAPREIAASWSTAGPQLVVLTEGPRGAVAYRHGARVAQVVAQPVGVIDTVGAGDTLMAWLVGGLMDVGVETRYHADSVTTVLQRAVRAAGLTCTRQGCQPPTAAEVG